MKRGTPEPSAQGRQFSLGLGAPVLIGEGLPAPAAPPLDPPLRGHGFKMGHTRYLTDARCSSFSARSVDRWNDLQDHVVAESNIDVSKVLLADSLGDALFSYQM